MRLIINKGMTEADVYDNAIFMLQTIEVGGQLFNLFFNSGCGDMVVRKSAADCLEKLGRAKLEVTGPITLSGGGDQMSVCEHRAYSICLPLRNGRKATLSGICLDKVKAEFPRYPLKHINHSLKSMCMNLGAESEGISSLNMASQVGRETDILIGIKYA